MISSVSFFVFPEQSYVCFNHNWKSTQTSFFEKFGIRNRSRIIFRDTRYFNYRLVGIIIKSIDAGKISVSGRWRTVPFFQYSISCNYFWFDLIWFFSSKHTHGTTYVWTSSSELAVKKSLVFQLFSYGVAYNFVPINFGSSNWQLPPQGLKGGIRHCLVVFWYSQLVFRVTILH